MSGVSLYALLLDIRDLILDGAMRIFEMPMLVKSTEHDLVAPYSNARVPTAE